jgi:hypothetical protein
MAHGGDIARRIRRFFGNRRLLHRNDAVFAGRNARCRQTAPAPISESSHGRLNASLATVLGLDAKPIEASAVYGPALSAGVIANAAV